MYSGGNRFRTALQRLYLSFAIRILRPGEFIRLQSLEVLCRIQELARRDRVPVDYLYLLVAEALKPRCGTTVQRCIDSWLAGRLPWQQVEPAIERANTHDRCFKTFMPLGLICRGDANARVFVPIVPAGMSFDDAPQTFQRAGFAIDAHQRLLRIEIVFRAADGRVMRVRNVEFPLRPRDRVLDVEIRIMPLFESGSAQVSVRVADEDRMYEDRILFLDQLERASGPTVLPAADDLNIARAAAWVRLLRDKPILPVSRIWGWVADLLPRICSTMRRSDPQKMQVAFRSLVCGLKNMAKHDPRIPSFFAVQALKVSGVNRIAIRRSYRRLARAGAVGSWRIAESLYWHARLAACKCPKLSPELGDFLEIASVGAKEPPGVARVRSLTAKSIAMAGLPGFVFDAPRLVDERQKSIARQTGLQSPACEDSVSGLLGVDPDDKALLELWMQRPDGEAVEVSPWSSVGLLSGRDADLENLYAIWAQTGGHRIKRIPWSRPNLGAEAVVRAAADNNVQQLTQMQDPKTLSRRADSNVQRLTHFSEQGYALPLIPELTPGSESPWADATYYLPRLQSGGGES